MTTNKRQMLSVIDERNGLVKTDWSNIRNRINKVAPAFAKIVDELSPDKTFSIYLAYYPYGDLKGDTISPFLPAMDGTSYRLSNPDIPRDVRNDLGYGSDGSPLGMVLEKKLEYFIDLKDIGITIPWQVLSPGSFFPLSSILEKKSKIIYSPNGLLTAVSGARSVFMLPKIGCLTNHQLLQRDYNVLSPPPKSLYDHWEIFREINKSGLKKQNEWKSCIIYFSKKWVDKINNDASWNNLKKFLLELANDKHEYHKNHMFYDIAYSLIQYKRKLKPNPYLVDTICHLYKIAAGALPSYTPVCDEEFLPLGAIQQAFVESYGQKKYIPTILSPSYFSIQDKNQKPVYYSLQYPTTLSFSPKSRNQSSTIFEMRELKHIMDVFNGELSKENSLLSDTIIGEVARRVDFQFYHNNIDKHNIIRQTKYLNNHDQRFLNTSSLVSSKNAVFSADAPFVRGCISIGVKK